MKVHNSRLLSALLDGELKGIRRWLVQRHLRRCAVCAAEYRHLHHVQQLLAAHPPTATMGDSPEFFWSKVRREIQRREEQPLEWTVPRLGWRDWLGQHQPVLAAATVVLIAALGLLFAYRPSPRGSSPLATVGHVATAIPNTTATAFQSEDEDVTVIWVSGLPWTENMNEMKTLYANLDT